MDGALQYSQLVHPRRCWLNSRGCWDCLIVDAWRFMWSSQTLPRKTPRSWESKKGSSPARLTPLWGSFQLKHSFIKHLESWVLTDIYCIRYMKIRLVLMMYHVVSVPTAHLKVVTECCTLAGCKSGNWRVSSTAPFILLTGLRRQRWNGETIRNPPVCCTPWAGPLVYLQPRPLTHQNCSFNILVTITDQKYHHNNVYYPVCPDSIWFCNM